MSTDRKYGSQDVKNWLGDNVGLRRVFQRRNHLLKLVIEFRILFTNVLVVIGEVDETNEHEGGRLLLCGGVVNK